MSAILSILFPFLYNLAVLKRLLFPYMYYTTIPTSLYLHRCQNSLLSMYPNEKTRLMVSFVAEARVRRKCWESLLMIGLWWPTAVGPLLKLDDSITGSVAFSHHTHAHAHIHSHTHSAMHILAHVLSYSILLILALSFIFLSKCYLYLHSFIFW